MLRQRPTLNARALASTYFLFLFAIGITVVVRLAEWMFSAFAADDVQLHNVEPYCAYGQLIFKGQWLLPILIQPFYLATWQDVVCCFMMVQLMAYLKGLHPWMIHDGLTPLLYCMHLTLTTLRGLLGFIFFRGTGYAYPRYYYFSGYYECIRGLHSAFLLWAFVACVLASYATANGRYDYFHVPSWKVWAFVFVALITMHIMSLNFVWTLWSILGMGWILVTAAVVVERNFNYLGLQQWILSRMIQTREYKSAEKSAFADGRYPQNVSNAWSTGLMLSLLGPILLISSLFLLTIGLRLLPYFREALSFQISPSLHQAFLDKMGPSHPILSILVMTFPRSGHPLHLFRVINSILYQFPEDHHDPFLNRVELHVFTAANWHPIFMEAFQTHIATQNVNFYRQNTCLNSKETKVFPTIISANASTTPILPQSLHFAWGLKWLLDQSKAEFIMVAEDDFPLCSGTWQTMEQVLVSAMMSSPGQVDDTDWRACGVFIGTGGSGMIFPRSIAVDLISALLSPAYQRIATDIVMQYCLRGLLQECVRCKRGPLVPSRRMLSHHIGHSSSTYERRVYNTGDYQCGWRQPLTGEPFTQVSLIEI